MQFVRLIASEMKMDFPKPFVLLVDNTTAEAFANRSVHKSKLKHIDCRQEWVLTLRDKAICKLAHIPTKENVADIFTKILPAPTFVYLRDKIMHRRSYHGLS